MIVASILKDLVFSIASNSNYGFFFIIEILQKK